MSSTESTTQSDKGVDDRTLPVVKVTRASDDDSDSPEQGEHTEIEPSTAGESELTEEPVEDSPSEAEILQDLHKAHEKIEAGLHKLTALTESVRKDVNSFTDGSVRYNERWNGRKQPISDRPSETLLQSDSSVVSTTVEVALSVFMCGDLQSVLRLGHDLIRAVSVGVRGIVVDDCRSTVVCEICQEQDGKD